MFQSFTSQSNGNSSAERLNALRLAMTNAGVDVFLVPHCDEYQNEYLPSGAERLAWLTGFTGSAGFAVVTHKDAILFVDGRYTVQAEEQTDAAQITREDLVARPPEKWLKEQLEDNETIGFDPWLTTHGTQKRLRKAIEKTGCSLKPVGNLIDEIWQDQPAEPLGPTYIQELENAGKLAMHKLEELKQELIEADTDACLITDPTSICWLFNIRGADVEHVPLTLARCILRAEGFPLLFIDKRKLSREVEAYLTQIADLHAPAHLEEELAGLSNNARIQIDPASVPVFLTKIIEENSGKIIGKRDPVILPRATKNETEIKGSRSAHLRDGVALSKFLYWLDLQVPGTISEVDAATRLEEIRTEYARSVGSELLEISFDTISASAGNSALPHYRVSEESNLTLEDGSIYLVDSGGQYVDGTTDITRTIPIGTPSEIMVRDNTLVLKGHIDIALARFPAGTRGQDIDILARNALWQEGKDFAHGTGHGVGSYLSVHEGPQNISKRGVQELLPGMIVSNEPGYYVVGEYGIRIENLVLVYKEEEIHGGNTAMRGFETLSMAPIDLRLIDPSIMNDHEIEWLNGYHDWVNRMLAEYLDDDERQWLKHATRPISRED
ncbi:MAG: X-Pro aminopeptidase [Hyphomicrobiales bacterium]|nr:MAG: X-Pro aminopeptidase [Hyphomicrobiales bacterium]